MVGGGNTVRETANQTCPGIDRVLPVNQFEPARTMRGEKGETVMKLSMKRNERWTHVRTAILVT